MPVCRVRPRFDMDETTIMDTATYRAEGFADQRLCVMPRPQVEAALAREVTRRLTVTDAGWFPHASDHRRARPRGAQETIVILCASGAGTVRIGHESFAVRPSSCVIIPAGVPHEYWASHEDPWTIWWMHVRGTDVPDLTGASPEPPVTRLRSLDRVVLLFDELVTLLERRLSPASLLGASGVAWHLLSRITADSALPADGSPLERAMRYLEARVDGSIRVADLAAIVGMSPSHLSAQFRKATGGGPAAFHTSLKMTKARTLLDSTGMGVGEIAAAVGYVDPLYFSRQFRRVHGASPTTYRAHHKG